MDSKQEKMVREAQEGDKNAFTVLLRENEQRMSRVARSFLSCLQQNDTHHLSAIIYCDNIRYEYLADDMNGGAYALADFEAFLDTLTK